MKQFKYLSIAGLTFGLLVSCSSSDKEGMTKKVLLPLVKMKQAELTTFEHKIKVQGSVVTDEDVLLNSEMGGQVTKIYVKEGQRVAAGQTLVSLDASILSSNLNEIQTQLEYAEYMLQKQEELKKRGVGSEFDYVSAKNQVNSLKSRMKSVNAQRGKASVRAPFGGVIDQVFAKEGQVAGPQTPLIRLVDNDKVEITADISEKHLTSIRVGTEMEVSFPNYGDTVIRVKISHVGNYIEPTNRTFRISAQIQNNKVLLPNMLAELTITDLSVSNALVVPTASVLKDQNNNDFLYKAVANGKGQYKLKKIDVEVVEKQSGKAYVRVLSGSLKKGEFVVTEGAKGVTETDVVRTK